MDLPAQIAKETLYQAVNVLGKNLSLLCLDNLDHVIHELLPATKKTVAEITPHFGVVWPSALALTQFMEKHANAVRGKTVLEIGCGLALPSMAARLLGATSVIATDRHALVPTFLSHNLNRNALQGIRYARYDWRSSELPVDNCDLVLGSDLLYEPWQPGYLVQTLAQLLTTDHSIAWIADPGRKHLGVFLALAEAHGFDCQTHQEKVEFGRRKHAVTILSLTRLPPF
jgi:predicted nicotinamide N-methyase